MNEVLTAKVSIINSFALGPGITTADYSERLAGLLATLDIESGEIIPDEPMTSVTNIGEVDGSSGRVRWGEIVDWLEEHPGKSRTVVYNSKRTADVTASRMRTTYRYFEVEVEERDTGAAVILTCKHGHL